MVKKKQPKPPEHLREATKKWWTSVVADWDLEPHHVRLLTLAGESWDRCSEAREALEASGLTFSDRFSQPKARPEVAIERDSRLAFSRMLRELNLDGVPEPDARPPRVGGGH